MKQMINPMFTEKVKPVVKVGEVKSTPIYEANYVEKRNIKNIELYKEYTKFADLIASGKNVEDTDFKSAMSAFETKVKTQLGSRLQPPAVPPHSP